mgnify:CR=1 FL=1
MNFKYKVSSREGELIVKKIKIITMVFLITLMFVTRVEASNAVYTISPDSKTLNGAFKKTSTNFAIVLKYLEENKARTSQPRNGRKFFWKNIVVWMRALWLEKTNAWSKIKIPQKFAIAITYYSTSFHLPNIVA